MSTKVANVVIVGGDIAGWTAAAGLANSLKGSGVNITLLEMPDLINVEPVQYTAPDSFEWFSHIGIDTDELVRQTGATFRLGTGLHDVIADGDHRICAFGPQGAMMGFVHFNHYATRSRLLGQPVNLNDYSPTAVAARNCRFLRTTDEGADRMPPVHFGLNLNTEKLAQLLCKNAMINGVGVASGRIDEVTLGAGDGRIESLLLDDGTRVAADLFIDCSGENGLLIGATLGVKYDDWSPWLPCTRALGVTAKTPHDHIPVHHCTATDHGWLMSTPLQHRTACRFLYSPDVVGDEQAGVHVRERLGVDDPEALAMSDTRSGHREAVWHLNCVALGAAAGSVEPLELSSFHSLQSAVLRLARMWPAQPLAPVLATQYNRETINEFTCLRDFTLLRYLGSSWRTSPFWQRVAAMELPESLQQRLDLFRSRGRVRLDEQEIYPRDKWVAGFLAAEQWPRGYDPLLDSLDAGQLQQHFANMKVAVAQAVRQMPEHRDYLEKIRG